jgi:diguanylate cyclase (GGDEF)-like protein
VLEQFKQSKFIQLTFVVSLIVSLTLIYLSERSLYDQKRLATKNIASSYVTLINNNISQALSAAYPLAALIQQQDGNTAGFTGLATEMLAFYPGVASLQLQPNGIITEVVPLKGNEKSIGHDVLSDPDRNKEALLARETGQLTLAGPFNLIQGGIGAAARLPIYLHNQQFWGFSAVLIRFPEILDSANLSSLADAGYTYQLSRIHPDSGEVHIFAESNSSLVSDPEIFYIDVPNGQWTFSITPIKGWSELTPLIIKTLFGLLFTLLISFLALLIVRLKDERSRLEYLVFERTKELESIAHYDALTQLPNRILFAERFSLAVAHCQRAKAMIAICFVDLDDFKTVNDSYGHEAGDQLLIEVASRLKTTLRSEDTVSRHGGDEFILLLNDIASLDKLEIILSRIQQSMTVPYIIKEHSHHINLSIGATLYPDDNVGLDTLLRHADHAMYQAKSAGKNRYHLFNGSDDNSKVKNTIKRNELDDDACQVSVKPG